MKKFIQHTKFTSGKRGNAAPHSNYIAGKSGHAKKEGVIYVEDANLPPWTKKDAAVFFRAADRKERKSYCAVRKNRRGETFIKKYTGRSYIEIVWAIPRQIQNPTSWARLAAHILMNGVHPYRLAVHCVPASDSRLNTHLHLMFSERVLDGIDRDAHQFFKRANKGYYRDKRKVLKRHDESKGGSPKDRMWNARCCPGKLRQVYRHFVQQELPQYEFVSSASPEMKIGPKLKNAGAGYTESRERREKLVHQQRAERLSSSSAPDTNEPTMEWIRAEAELNRYFASKGMHLLECLESIEKLQRENHPEMKVQLGAGGLTQEPSVPAPSDDEAQNELSVDLMPLRTAKDESQLPLDPRDDDNDFSL